MISSSEQQGRKKNRHEERLKKKLRPIFKPVLSIIRRSIESSTDIFSLFDFEDALTSELSTHYELVRDDFQSEMTEHFDLQESSFASQLGIIGFGAYTASRAPRQARIITTGTIKDANASKARAAEELRRVDQQVNRTSLIRTSLAIARRLFSNKISAVAQFETQQSSEAAKAIQADALGRSPTPIILKKTWFTERDERVRNRHAATEGQVRPVLEPFDVGGQAMQFPADASLGADLSNIIGCRCSAVYDRQ